MTLARRRVVRVPASSANLGPGFDVLAAALALYLELEVSETGAFAVHTDLDVSRGRDNLVVRAFERLHPADGFEFRISSQIPLSGGLGSSAAAALAGLLAADHLFELDADVRAHATELEGHPDNVAAALHGGFVICDGPRVHRLEPPMGLEAVIVVPTEPVATERARAALPASVPLADAVFNVACASMLTSGLTTGDWDLIAAGLRDRLHQPYREHLYPRSAALLQRRPIARRARGDDLGRRAVGPVLVSLRAHGRARAGARTRDARVGERHPSAVRAPRRRRHGAVAPRAPAR